MDYRAVRPECPVPMWFRIGTLVLGREEFRFLKVLGRKHVTTTILWKLNLFTVIYVYEVRTTLHNVS